MTDTLQVDVDTTGLDKLIELFEGDINQALFAAGWQIAGEAKTNAPYEFGNLRDSIRAKIGDEKNSVIITDGMEYGIYQEFGTYKMAAQPFMLPAFLKVTDKLVNITIPQMIEGAGQ